MMKLLRGYQEKCFMSFGGIMEWEGEREGEGPFNGGKAEEGSLVEPC